MTNLETLNKPELSPEEEVINETSELIDDFKDEIPVTKEEAKKLSNDMQKLFKPMLEGAAGLEKFLKESAQIEWLLKKVGKWILEKIDEARNAWLLKWNEWNDQKLANIIDNLSNSEDLKSFLVKNEELDQYFLDPEWVFTWINKLDKQDRKFIKQTWKALNKLDEKRRKDEIKKEKQNAKFVKNAREEFRNRIN